MVLKKEEISVQDLSNIISLKGDHKKYGNVRAEKDILYAWCWLSQR